MFLSSFSSNMLSRFLPSSEHNPQTVSVATPASSQLFLSPFLLLTVQKLLQQFQPISPGLVQSHIRLLLRFPSTRRFSPVDFGVAEHNPHLIGRYAGFLASLFPFAQFCTSLLWGSVSDRVGRKPVLMFGNIVASVSAVLFGLSGNYTMACLVRLIGGFLNGVITVTKTTLGELCDKTNQRQGFAVLSLGWGIGTIAGQVIGGVAARPCQQYNFKHCPAILRHHPFILPCIGAAFFSAVAAIATFFLTETLNRSGFVKIEEEALELVEAPGGFVGGSGRGSGDASLSEENSAGVGVFLEGLGRSRETDEESALLKRPVVSDDQLARGGEDRSTFAARLSTNRGGFESLQEEKSALVSRGSETDDCARVLRSTETATVGEDIRGSSGGVPAVVLVTGICGNAESMGDGLKSDGLKMEQAAEVETGFSYKSGEPLLMEGNCGKTHAVGRGQKVDGLEYGKLPDLETGSERLLGTTDTEQGRGESTSRKDRFYLQDPDVWIASGTYGMTAFIHIIGGKCSCIICSDYCRQVSCSSLAVLTVIMFPISCQCLRGLTRCLFPATTVPSSIWKLHSSDSGRIRLLYGSGSCCIPLGNDFTRSVEMSLLVTLR
jgi:MFS family permease